MTDNAHNLKRMEYSEGIFGSCCVFGRSWVLEPPKVILMTYNVRFFLSFFLWHNRSTRALTVSLLRFLHHTQLDTPIHYPSPPQTHRLGRISLNEWSARRRGRNLQKTQTQEKKSHAHSGIRTHNLSNRAAAAQRLRRHSHRDWPFPQFLRTNCGIAPKTASKTLATLFIEIHVPWFI